MSFDTQRQFAKARIGATAHPTTNLRMLQDDVSARLQQEWLGEFGSLWLDVPVVRVPVLPPRDFE